MFSAVAFWLGRGGFVGFSILCLSWYFIACLPCHRYGYDHERMVDAEAHLHVSFASAFV